MDMMGRPCSFFTIVFSDQTHNKLIICLQLITYNLISKIMDMMGKTG